MLITTKAIPIGRKIPILPATIPTMMKRRPLIEKSVAAVLYDFEFLDSLRIVKASILYSGLH